VLSHANIHVMTAHEIIVSVMRALWITVKCPPDHGDVSLLAWFR
jgi:hypothetical protein